MKITCSATILTLNSAKTLRQCLESVKDFEDIVVLDGGSTDGTSEIAREFGARVFPQYENTSGPQKITNFTELRKKSFDLAKHDWVFYLDSDEYLSDELKKEIEVKLVTPSNPHPNEEGDKKEVVYYFNRIAIVDGKIAKHAFFYPEYTLRLINKKGGTKWKEGAVVHEGFILAQDAEEVYLKSPLYAIWPSYKEVIAKDNYYLSLVEQKFARQVEDFTWFKYLRSLVINKLKTLNILCKILKTYLRYGFRNTMPFKYQMRFVRYHLLMAFSMKKFRLMLRKYASRRYLHSPLDTD